MTNRTEIVNLGLESRSDQAQSIDLWFPTVTLGQMAILSTIINISVCQTVLTHIHLFSPFILYEPDLKKKHLLLSFN